VSTSPVQLIVGLANPGPQYQATRHNAGAWFIDTLIERFQGNLSPEIKFHGLAGTLKIGSDSVKLLVPMTYMNCSGQSVAACANYYKIPVENILVAHDELDFAPGKVKLKQGGGHGGHNGLRNVVAQMGKDFWRLRIGIGHPGHRDQVTDYVLSQPSKADRSEILLSLSQATDLVPILIKGEWQKAMGLLHS